MQRWTVSPAARVEILGRYWWRIRRRATEGAKAKSKGKARRGSVQGSRTRVMRFEPGKVER